MHSLREELVAISRQLVDVDLAHLHRPEPPAAGLVSEIHVFVGGADEYTLPWFVNVEAAIAWTISFIGATDEALEQRGFSLPHRMHLGNLDQPFAAQVLGGFFP